MKSTLCRHDGLVVSRVAVGCVPLNTFTDNIHLGGFARHLHRAVATAKGVEVGEIAIYIVQDGSPMSRGERMLFLDRIGRVVKVELTSRIGFLSSWASVTVPTSAMPTEIEYWAKQIASWFDVMWAL